MRVLITGGGLVGSYSAAVLLSRGHSVTVFDRAPDSAYVTAVSGSPVPMIAGDVRDVDALAEALVQNGCDVVVHAAGALRASFSRSPFDSYGTNLYGALCVAEAANRAGARRLVLCSSLAVYDFSITPAGGAIAEDHPQKAEGLYDHSKALAEMALRPYCREVGIDLVVLRLAGVYGAGQFRGGAWMGRQLQQLLLAALDGGEIMLSQADFGDNEYVYVKDVAQAVSAACTASVDGHETLNIGAGRVARAEELAAAIGAALPGLPIRYSPAEACNLPAFMKRVAPLSIRKAQKALGYRPHYSDLRDGLCDYLQELQRLRSLL